ncbi:signal peptidase I [Herbiconiux sp. L3-i23]|uniref:signal peptidase I n=1 Tax=Herbiconiux sp. L3-i23 TaxID=2905871 RepID=UPI002063F59A|nr:signal peptidase I [Herbiconiux sp. L3-i23]BDI21507.1 hypothetical protein L3i23_02830 [Herbiconiux sp. L3-i23]
MHRKERGFSLPETLLALTACIGLLSLLWLVSSTSLGLTLVSFKTGSMSPTMPTDTVALTVPTPAGEIEVGDVITVQRAGELPITHRVTAIESGTDSAERLLTLRGDANDDDDALPYEVSEAGRVVAWIPGAAPLMSLMTQPSALGLLVIVVGALLIWALFPEKGAYTSTARTGRAAHRRTA